MIKPRAAIFLAMSLGVMLGGVSACKPENEQATLETPYDQRVEQERYRYKLSHALSDCSTANNTPVAPCSDWITGPASIQNADIKIYLRKKTTGSWQAATLFETDQGWPVMSPDGKSLELMAYGDTWVRNPAYKIADREAAIQACSKQSVAKICGPDKKCSAYFNSQPDKLEACAYWLAQSDHRQPANGLSLAAFDSSNNVVFLDAEIEPQSPYRIKFHEHLRDKIVRHNAMENSYKGKSYFTGVYTTDYFYLCPQTAPSCLDADKILHFLTGTVYWHYVTQPDVNKLGAPEKYFKLTREGMGVYRFGPLAAKTDTSSGCRVRFAPITTVPPGKPPVSCPSSLAEDLRPEDRILTAPAVVVGHSENPNVIWGWGGKFAQAIVMHGFIDPRHSGTSKSLDYIYFLGSGEVTSWINKTTNAANYTATSNLYVARLPANESALAKGQFEYYRGVAGGKSLWGSYDQAKPLFNTIAPIFPTSFTRRHGRYYIAASCGLDFTKGFAPAHGMCVTSSRDGYKWDKHDYAKYSDLVISHPSTKLVYGHAWVPAGLFPHATAIPYVFSVWNAADGYAADFWFTGRPKYPLPLEKRFPFYNTKMYLYWPQR